MSQSRGERLLRSVLRGATPPGLARFAITSAGTLCATALFVEHLYTIQPCEGPSMFPTFNMFGDYVLVSRRHKHGRGVAVGDVVRFYHPMVPGVHAAKRVLGLPGDFVCREQGCANGVGGEGEMIQVPSGHVWVTGDNLPWSRDSRLWGPIPLGLVNGKVIARIWPWSKREFVQNPLQPANLPVEDST